MSWISEIPSKSLKAMILRDRGRPGEARALLETIEDVPTGIYEESRAICVLAETYADEGRYAEAIATARKGIDAAGEDVIGRAWCMRALARAHHLNGERDSAERVLRDELSALENTDWDEERVRVLALLARAHGHSRHDCAPCLRAPASSEWARTSPPAS